MEPLLPIRATGQPQRQTSTLHLLHTPWLVLAAACAALLALEPGAQAAPFTPSDDAQVLERLPGRNTLQFRELKSLQAAAARAPDDLDRAVALASAYIQQSRVEGDPRFLGYAQAVLGRWWQGPAPPTAVLILRATILQSSHNFDAATSDLSTVLQREPGNAQALLTRATVLTVQGKYTEARRDCDRMQGVLPRIYAVICVAAIDSMTGNAAQAYASLALGLDTLPRVDGAAREWGETILGEIAHRRDDPAAERHFRAALELDAGDLYLLGAYADWLLDQRRPAEVVALLQNQTRVDPLLLRLALAQQALHRPEAAASIAALTARFDASHARGDTVHQRENARFELQLRGDAHGALPYALANWKVQREAADLRILAEVAFVTSDPTALEIVRQWLGTTRVEYPLAASPVSDRLVPAK